MSTLKVDGIRSNSASSDAITLASDGTCTANITNNLSNRNLIINGAMQVAQRGTSSTSAGYQTVDRFTTSMAGTDEACTFAQVDVTADTDPWNLGFRKAFKVTNGNQTSGAGASDDLSLRQNIEAQNISNSGWDYTSSSSFITLSFWVKSSVAQTFYTGFRIYGSDQREYCFSYALSANTWTKVTKSIPGADGNSILNSNALGAFIQWPLWWGTDFTSSGRAVDTWQVKNNASNYPDNTSTWYTTNDATFEITGVQLEVGSVATDFEHRSYAQELALCQRYCEVILEGEGDGAYMVNSVGYATDQMYAIFRFAVEKRASPTLVHTSGSKYYVNYRNNSGQYFNGFTGLSWPNKRATGIYNSSSVTAGHAGLIGSAVSGAKVYVTAEL